MISIAWYSVCNFIAGFAPSFWFLFLFRALLGIGMGAEWPAGAALAMETWPARSRGFMGGVLQGSWGIGFLLSSAAYGLLYDTSAGAACCGSASCRPLSIIYVRYSSRSREVWVENRAPAARAEARGSQRRCSSIFKRGTARQYPDRVLVDGQRLRRLLLDLGAVRDPSAEGPAFRARRWSRCRSRWPTWRPSWPAVLGLAGGPHRPALGDDHPGGDRRSSSRRSIC